MEIKVKNHLGNITALDPLKFPVVNVEGLTPAGATINTTRIATVDGTFLNTTYVNERNIVLTITPEGDAEKARLFLYQYFKPKYPVTLYFKTRTRNVYIDGVVESFEGGLYEQKQSFQISVICPQSFFNNLVPTITEQAKAISAFSFPFSTPESGIPLSYLAADVETNVINEGEEATGVVITLTAIGTVLEPTIYNRTTGERFTIREEMQTGDVIQIDTRRGKKTIYRMNGATPQNILNKIAKNSNWFTLSAGQNLFTYDCLYGTENLNITYEFSAQFGGI